MKPKVFIKPIEGNLTDCVRECFNAFGGVDSIIKGNVFLKMNATMPVLSAITNPDLILSTIKVIKEASVKFKNIYVFDNCAVGFFTRLVYTIQNLGKRIKKLGAIPLYLDEKKSIEIDFNGKALDKPIPIPKILYENLIENKSENTYINLPKLKTHLQTGLTNCIKNQHGLLYDDEKVYNHHLINEKIIDILGKFKPDFNVVDATTVVDYGQVAITPEWEIPMGLLMSGKDPVAIDTVGAKLLGIKIEDVKYLQMAANQGFGSNNLDEINILPSKDLIDQYKLQLHCEGIPLKSSEKVKLIRGQEKVCRTGCLTLGFYFTLLTHDTDFGPCIGVIGKGHDTKKLDQYSGPFIVNGPCAVSELKEYFENRVDRKKIKVFYINDHCNLSELMIYVRKGCRIPLSHILTLVPVSMFKVILSIIISKLHGVKCQFIF